MFIDRFLEWLETTLETPQPPSERLLNQIGRWLCLSNLGIR